jgi:chromate reductase, NAD(P)H dehydrogenase (quinone)
MITVISGTNRADSMTIKAAALYQQLLAESHQDAVLLTLEDKEVWVRGAQMLELEQKYLVPAAKFVLVMPEYNASFPGILKTMIDNCDVKKCWWYKKALLVGISDGRAGNIRGLEHMTSILHYLRVQVHYNKMILSRIRQEVDEAGSFNKPETVQMIREQVTEFVNF